VFIFIEKKKNKVKRKFLLQSSKYNETKPWAADVVETNAETNVANAAAAAMRGAVNASLVADHDAVICADVAQVVD
jgi:hypothetical protein